MSRASRRWTGAFLVAQLALSVVMLSNIVVAVRAARAALPSDATLLAEDVVTATVSLPVRQYSDAAARLGFYDSFAEGMKHLPGLHDLALTSALPTRAVPEQRLIGEGSQPDAAVPVRQVVIGPGYFDTLGLPLTAGRSFTPRDGAPGEEHVVINERLAALLFSGADPLGRRVAFAGSDASAPAEWLTVIGIAPAALPGVHLADPVVLLAIAAVLGTIALLACLAPIRRAQAIRPVTILRHE